MFAAILRTQWKWTRIAALIGFVLGFAIPIMSLFAIEYMRAAMSPASIVREMQQMSALYAFLAGAMGLACGMLAWGHDHRGRHVYALSLPITRSRYAGMRFGAGALCLLVPVLGVLLGCVVGIVAVDVPAGLHTYPIALTLRFLLACFVSYAVFFAISASSTKASAYILGAIAGILVLFFILSALGIGDSAINFMLEALFGDRGLLSVFTGRWMLIDV